MSELIFKHNRCTGVYVYVFCVVHWYSFGMFCTYKTHKNDDGTVEYGGGREFCGHCSHIYVTIVSITRQIMNNLDDMNFILWVVKAFSLVACWIVRINKM